MVKKIRKVLAICLAVVLCMSIIPATVFAGDACMLLQHVHDELCYEEQLTCTEPDHTHADECYVSALVCALDEVPETNSSFNGESEVNSG